MDKWLTKRQKAVITPLLIALGVMIVVAFYAVMNYPTKADLTGGSVPVPNSVNLYNR